MSKLTNEEEYDQKHAVAVMKMLNSDRKTAKMFCDGVLKAEDKDFPIHKCLIGLVSDVLGKMFSSEMKEKYENSIPIKNLSHKTLEDILNFVYTGVIVINDDNVCTLLEGADYANIADLVSMCKNYLLNGVCTENCVRLLGYAHRYNIEELHCKAACHGAANLSTVLLQDEFLQMPFEDLCSVMVERRQVSAEVTFTAAVTWVNHNNDEREKLFSKLFSFVNPTSLSRYFFNKVVRSEDLVISSLECMRQILQSSEKFDWICEEKQVLAIANIGGVTDMWIQKFDPDRKEIIPQLEPLRCGTAATKVGHELFVLGGALERRGGKALRNVESYNLIDKSGWGTHSHMLERRQHCASSLYNGFIFVSGGRNNKMGYLSSCEKYDIELDCWTKMADMLKIRGCHSMLLLNGFLYCIGGTTGGDEILSSAERYNPMHNKWVSIAPMKRGRFGLTTVAHSGSIYAIGGYNAKRQSCGFVERYDPGSDAWTELNPLHAPRAYHGACVLNGSIHVFGGKDEETFVEVYDAANDKWEKQTEMKMKLTGEEDCMLFV